MREGVLPARFSLRESLNKERYSLQKVSKQDLKRQVQNRSIVMYLDTALIRIRGRRIPIFFTRGVYFNEFNIAKVITIMQ